MPSGPRPALPPQVVRVAVTGNIGGQPFANIFHAQTDQPGINTPAGVNDFLTAFNTALEQSGFYSPFSTTLHVTQLEGVVQITADTALKGLITSTISGTGAGTGTPVGTCVVFSWLSEIFWRGGHPRTYVGGVLTTMSDTNHSLVDSVKNTLILNAQGLHTRINQITTPAVDQTKQGLVSYASGGAWRPTALFFPYTGVTVHDRLGSQRRRLGPWLR